MRASFKQVNNSTETVKIKYKSHKLMFIEIKIKNQIYGNINVTEKCRNAEKQ